MPSDKTGGEPVASDSTVVLADPSWLVRLAVRGILEREGDFTVVGEAETGQQLIELAAELQPGMLVIDAGLRVQEDEPGSSGGSSATGVCRAVLQAVPHARVLVMGAHMDESLVASLVAAGAAGCMDKNVDQASLLFVANTIARGEYYLPAWLIRRLVARIGTEIARDENRASTLTQREREILQLYARGGTYADIGAVLNRHPLTVRNTMYRIKRKLGEGSMQGVIVWAVRNGLVEDAA